MDRPADVVFPNAEDAPASLAEKAINPAVPGLVGGELFPPERATNRRESGVPGTAVPEAAVNEDGQTTFWKCEVGRAGNFQVTPPAGNMMAAEQLHQGKLGVLVAAPANA